MFLFVLLLLLGVRNSSDGRTWSDTLTALFGYGTDENLKYFIHHLRLPRIAGAIAAGAALAVSGAVLQTVLNNALASPFTLGLSQGAAFGATFAVSVLGAGMIQNTGTAIVVNSLGIMAFSAFVGALSSGMLILGFTLVRGMTPQGIILAGVAVSSFFGAGTMLLQFFSSDTQLAAAVFWTFGDLGRGGWTEAVTLCAVMFSGLLFALRYSWDYNALLWGDGHAAALGVHVKKLRFYSVTTVSLMAAFATAFYGVIGFVGLIAPHSVRLIFPRCGQGFLIRASAVTGGLLLLGADILAQRAAYPLALPVGIVTSFAGVPVFLYLLIKRAGKNA